MASESLSDKGRLEIEVVIKGLQELERLNELERAGADVDKQREKTMREVSRAADKVRGSVDGTATATQKAVAATKEHNGSLISARYALYDVATTYGILSAAMIGASALAITTGARFESAFTNVERTSNDSVAGLRNLRGELVDLSSQIPLTFEELAKIATLGNQLGIPEDAVESFTQTVAQFATVTGMTVEASATAFGSLGELLNLTEADYVNLGSAIAYVGRQSVATEPEIVALATRLAASATNAGFTAQEVVALSGALASLRVAPERAQGVMEVYFNRLNNALASGGEKLAIFAMLAGTTESEIANLVATDPNKFFRDFAAGLGSLDSVSQTQALEALGLSGIRAGEVFGRVSGNLGVFDKALSDSNKSYREGTELAEQYAKVVDDLNSRWMTLVNSVNSLIDAASGGSVQSLADLLAILVQVVDAARGFVSTPVGQFISGITIALAVLVGGLFAYRSIVALATASTFALTTAQAQMTAAGLQTGIRGLAAALFGVKAATDASLISTQKQVIAQGNANAQMAAGTAFSTRLAAGQAAAGISATTATAGVLKLRTALFALGRATLIIGFIQILTELLFDFNGAMQSVPPFANFMIDVVNNVGQAFWGAAAGVTGFFAAVTAGSGLGGFWGDANAEANRLSNGWSTAAESARRSILGSTRGVKQGKKGVDALNDSVFEGAEAFDDMGGAAGGAAAEVRTLVDYASDLRAVWDRAFEIRFSGQQGMDGVTTGWRTIAQAISDANDEIAEHSATLAGLAADKGVKEYWLSVAENYGDALRAAELRAELAQIDVDSTKTQKALTKAQNKTNKTLEGNSDAAIANRAEILGLVENYQGYIGALAQSGLGQAELSAETARLKSDFIAQATQLGYNSSELGIYASAFDDVTLAINAVPRNLTVNSDINPAITALNELQARLNSAVGGPGGGGYTVPVRIEATGADGIGQLYGQSFKVGFQRGANGAFLYYDGTGSMTGRMGDMRFVKDGGPIYGPGTPTSDSIPAMLSNGEFVFSAKAARNIGMGNLANLHKSARRGYATGGPVGRGSAGGGGMGMGAGVVHLSPADRQLLIDIRDRSGIVLDTAPIGNSVMAQNTNASQRRNA